MKEDEVYSLGLGGNSETCPGGTPIWNRRLFHMGVPPGVMFHGLLKTKYAKLFEIGWKFLSKNLLPRRNSLFPFHCTGFVCVNFVQLHWYWRDYNQIGGWNLHRLLQRAQ